MLLYYVARAVYVRGRRERGRGEQREEGSNARGEGRKQRRTEGRDSTTFFARECHLSARASLFRAFALLSAWKVSSNAVPGRETGSGGRQKDGEGKHMEGGGEVLSQKEDGRGGEDRPLRPHSALLPPPLSYEGGRVRRRKNNMERRPLLPPPPLDRLTYGGSSSSSTSFSSSDGLTHILHPQEIEWEKGRERERWETCVFARRGKKKEKKKR